MKRSCTLNKIFDWGGHLSFGLDENGKVRPDLSGRGLNKPQNFSASLYGVVKRNGKWHGTKMNF